MTAPLGVIRDGVIPNLPRLAEIWESAGLAILLIGVGRGSNLLRDLGWRGERVQVGRLRKRQISRLVDAIRALCPEDASRPAVRWLRAKSGARLFVVTGGETMCLNFDERTGLTQEPGTVSMREIVPGD